MKTLYLGVTSGISGDMTLALLIALGADSNKLSSLLSSLLNKNIKITVEKRLRNGISCSKLVIEADVENEPFRHFSSIKEIISGSKALTDKVKEKSIEAFQKIAESESEAHGIDLEEVHFHEIGAVDTIIDIVGTAWCLEELKIHRVVSSHLICGRGTVETQHGVLPLPTPATLAILRGIPLTITDIEGELITPTGAAILKTHVLKYTDIFSGTPQKEAYSTGDKEFKGATNMLQGIIFEEEYIDSYGVITCISSNIDDMTGEAFGFLLDGLMKIKGVQDVSYTPAFGKKNRPLYILNVMLESDCIETVVKFIFKNSSTAGVRFKDYKRLTMEREFIEVDVEGFNIKVKRLFFSDIEKFYPEWDDCAIASKITNLPVAEIYNRAAAKAKL